MGNASTADNKVIHRTFEKPEKLMEEQPEPEEQENVEEEITLGSQLMKTTSRIHELIEAAGRNVKSYKEIEKMTNHQRNNIASGKAFPTQNEFLTFLAKHNLTKQFCEDVNEQLTVMNLCFRYQTSYELMRTVAHKLETPFRAPLKNENKKKRPDNFLLAELVGKISNLEHQIKELRGEHTVLNKIVRDVSELIAVTHDKLGEIREYTEVEWHDETTY